MSLEVHGTGWIITEPIEMAGSVPTAGCRTVFKQRNKIRGEWVTTNEVFVNLVTRGRIASACLRNAVKGDMIVIGQGHMESMAVEPGNDRKTPAIVTHSIAVVPYDTIVKRPATRREALPDLPEDETEQDTADVRTLLDNS